MIKKQIDFSVWFWFRQKDQNITTQYHSNMLVKIWIQIMICWSKLYKDIQIAMYSTEINMNFRLTLWF